MSENSAAVKEKTKTKMPWGKFFAWKSRDISLAAVTVIVSGYLMMFCSDVLGMSTTLVGTLLMVSKIFDGVTDLFAGYIVDNTHTKLGKARPYEICILLEWLCTVLLFFCSPSWSPVLKGAWVFIMYTFVYSIFNTMLNGNQTPYMIRAFSNNRDIITKVSSWGGIVSMAGSIIVSISFPRLMARLVVAGQNASAGWRELVLIFAIPLAFIGILRFLLVKEDPSVDAGQSATKIDMHEILTMLRTNKYAWAFAGITGAYNLVYSLGAGSYYFQYIVGDISAFGIVSALGVVLLPVMIFFPTMIRRLGVAKLFIIFAAISCAGYICVFFAQGGLGLLYTGILATNLISLPVSYLGALVIMDLSTYNQYNGLHRMEGTTGIVSGFTSKLFGGIGTGLTGILLGAAGYISTTDTTSVTQPESALFMIRSLYSLIPAAFMVVIIICALIFRKLEKRMPEIEAEVKRRTEEQEA